MRKILFLVVLGVGLVSAGALAQDQPAAFDGERATIYRAAPGRPLTGPSQAGPVSVVTQFLRGHGVDASTVNSLRAAGENHVSGSGLTHFRMEQEVGGLRVADAYVKAALNARGELIQVIQNVAAVPSGKVVPARADERQALRAALASLYPALKDDPAVVSRDGNVTTFEKTAFFHAAPTVERVAIAMTNGALKEGFFVGTWSEKANLLHETLVGGDGRVLSFQLRTAFDSYRVFPVDPVKTAQTVIPGPGSGNSQSPSGWLFGGTQKSISIAGNNAHAYLDTDNDNKPDAGGTDINDGNFLSTADLTVSPSTSVNQNVAVQNLFYLSNVIHDELYRHGFNEAAGNFQEDNFGKGGRGGDSVNAEAQDGGGTDNANFATPRDGQNPRMQMYLWTGKPSHQVVVGSTILRASGAEFGPPLTPTGVTGVITLAHDGAGASDTDGCEAITTILTGAIALMDRGNCNFTVKVKNAQVAGAVGAIVANNAGDSLVTMSGTDSTITIPSAFIGQSDGTTLKGLAPATGTIRLTDPSPLQRDGDLDSDIVWHESCHGLTWRMIGRMSGAMSGAIGEGMSDVCAILINNNDVVAEYSFDDPVGLRTAPYHNYPRTYGDVAGTEVHFDGEVYGAIGWRLWEIFQANGLSKDLLFDYIVDGMNFTPAGPAFEDMRDGILQSVASSGSGHECLIWQAFAQYGVGVGAKGVARGKKDVVTESFELPLTCQ